MNYAKHVSRALVALLGASAAYVDAKVLKGIKTPGGTDFILVNKADRKISASWTHTQVKPSGKREHLVVEMDKDGIITNIIDSRTHTSLFEVDASGKWTIDEDGKVADAADSSKHWVLTYEDDPVGEERVFKRLVRTYILDKGKGVIIGIPLALLGAGVIAYKTFSSFKEAVDERASDASEFFADFKEGKGSARRNAGIGLAVALGIGAGLFYAHEGRFPFC